ncbi:hypothetical protein GA0116948_105235 [Chitinophaga costaii]|uniref:Uncharacterized protein n=1 Tax=Chitinophaga costaii TaxID=1335309 RepID=A0A1C4DEH8_9BACT|nr:hypothetical protein [Chitinophaga costaii]PUZ24596.1 hypothetical protein DCM91_11930 [Chitinophaga costaii]SCC29785.1 hypothetical protein GA0116948_105235 [Chitinophaga costaii]
MKISIYSTLAAALAVYAGHSARATTHNRLSYVYKYIGAYPVSAASLVTNVNNWTYVAGPPSEDCVDVIQACEVNTTITNTWPFGKRPTRKLPALQTISGPSPRFTVSPDWDKGITEVYSASYVND